MILDLIQKWYDYGQNQRYLASDQSIELPSLRSWIRKQSFCNFEGKWFATLKVKFEEQLKEEEGLNKIIADNLVKIKLAE